MRPLSITGGGEKPAREELEKMGCFGECWPSKVFHYDIIRSS